MNLSALIQFSSDVLRDSSSQAALAGALLLAVLETCIGMGIDAPVRE